MTTKQPTPAEKIEAARARIDELGAVAESLTAKRRAALMAGAPGDEISKFDAEIARIRHDIKTEEERISGLSHQLREADIAAAIERKNERIEELAGKLKDTDKLAVEIEQDFGELVAKFHKLCAERSELVPMFAGSNHEVEAAIGNPDGAALTAASIATLLSFDIYRQGARVPVPGQPISADPSWPLKAICPRLEWTSTPGRIKPFSEAIAQASNYATEILKTGRAPAILADVQADGPKTAAQMRLAELLSRMSVLAADPSKEAEYMLIVKEVALAQDAVELQREAFAQVVAAPAEPPASPALRRLDELRRRSMKMIERQELHSVEYLKLTSEITGLTTELQAQGLQV